MANDGCLYAKVPLRTGPRDQVNRISSSVSAFGAGAEDVGAGRASSRMAQVSVMVSRSSLGYARFVFLDDYPIDCFPLVWAFFFFRPLLTHRTLYTSIQLSHTLTVTYPLTSPMLYVLMCHPSCYCVGFS
jgi:hypothetical protein